MRKKPNIIVIILLSIVGIFLFGRFGLKIGNWEYDNFAEFKRNAYTRFVVDIPEGATDQKFFCRNTLFGEYSIYAFTPDKASYDKIINQYVREYNLTANPADDSNKYNSYASYYRMKVRDAHDPHNEPFDFPVDFHFEKVIKDDIRNYDIILYSPVGTGTSGYGLVVNPNTRRMVVYSEGNIR